MKHEIIYTQRNTTSKNAIMFMKNKNEGKIFLTNTQIIKTVKE